MRKAEKTEKKGFYTYEGDNYKAEIETKGILVLKSLDSTNVIIVDNNLNVIGKVSYTQVDFHEPMLEVENYSKLCTQL